MRAVTLSRRGSAAERWSPEPWTAVKSAPRRMAVPALAPSPMAPFDPGLGSHPLSEPAVSQGLRRRADEIDTAFDAIEPLLRDLAPRQLDPGFAIHASNVLRDRLGVEIPAEDLTTDWTRPLDLRALHARCVLGVFSRLIARDFDRDLARFSGEESAEVLIRRWGFHAVDISPCADGRLSGVVDYILRIPPAVVAWRTSHAGAMFDIADSVRRWESAELRRWREGTPNRADAPTRYLKIGVYHFSVADPDHEGCAAHGSDGRRAAGALLQRLMDFETAVRRLHGPAAAVATLLVGVDTDTDAIRVHPPGPDGSMAIDRYLDNRQLYADTAHLDREAAKTAIRDAVAEASGVGADDPRTEGMRWFCGYLLKNNLGQVDAVRAWHGGAYADGGHKERLIVVGDPIDEVQLRNLAFQAQMETLEASGADLFVGVSILRKRLEPLGLAIPVLVHVRFDSRIPGAETRARQRASRLREAILASHPGLVDQGRLHVEAAVRAEDAIELSPVSAIEATVAARRP